MDDVDKMTAADNPRKRLLVSALAVVLPVVALVGAAAWFVRSYVLPPTVRIDMSEPRTAAEPAAMPAAQAVAQPVAAPETTGVAAPAAPTPPEPAVRYTNNTADIWAAVPIPGPPRSTQSPAPEPDTATGETLTEAVPLPPRRPRSALSNAVASGVPLPRPRPVSAN